MQPRAWIARGTKGAYCGLGVRIHVMSPISTPGLVKVSIQELIAGKPLAERPIGVIFLDANDFNWVIDGFVSGGWDVKSASSSAPSKFANRYATQEARQEARRDSWRRSKQLSTRAHS